MTVSYGDLCICHWRLCEQFATRKSCRGMYHGSEMDTVVPKVWFRTPTLYDMPKKSEATPRRREIRA